MWLETSDGRFIFDSDDVLCIRRRRNSVIDIHFKNGKETEVAVNEAEYQTIRNVLLKQNEVYAYLDALKEKGFDEAADFLERKFCGKE